MFKKHFHDMERFLLQVRQMLLLSMYILYKSYKTPPSMNNANY